MIRLLPLLLLSSVAFAERPDVWIVTVDTLRPDRLGAYGYDRPTSPAIDELISGGVRFDDARTVEPLTQPALSALVTGSHPHVHGGSRNGLRIRSGLDSLPRELARHGYATAAFVGNWTLRDRISGLAEHFERYDEVLTRARWFGLVRKEAEGQDISAAAAEWLAATADDARPRMLWVHYVEPHAPYVDQKAFREPLGYPARGGLTKSERYDLEIAYVDRVIGDLLELRDRPTLVVFASDHGESLGEHGYWGHGRNVYDPGLRIPLAFRLDGVVRPGATSAPASILDIAPTVLGLLELDSPAAFAGFDWSAVLTGAAEPPASRTTYHQAHKGAVLSKHESSLARRRGLLEVAAVRDGRFKERVHIRSGERELFDLGDDPGETVNLKPDSNPSEGLLDWLKGVLAQLSRVDESDPAAELDDEAAARLRSLGYVD